MVEQLEERTASRKQSMRDQHLAAAQSLRLDNDKRPTEGGAAEVRPTGRALHKLRMDSLDVQMHNLPAPSLQRLSSESVL